MSNGTTMTVPQPQYDFFRQVGSASGSLPDGVNDTTKTIQRLGTTIIGGNNFADAVPSGVATPTIPSDYIILSSNTAGRGQILFGDSPLSYYFTRAIPTVVNDCTHLVRVSASFGGLVIRLHVSASSTSLVLGKSYLFTPSWNMTSGAWRVLTPVSDSGPHASGPGQDFEVNVFVTNGSVTFRVRRTLGTQSGTLHIRLETLGTNAVFATELNVTETDATVYPNIQTLSLPTSFWFSGTGSGKPDGNNDGTEAISRSGTVGIGKVDPTTNAGALDVTGSLVTRSVNLTDIASNGPIGTAAATVDITSYIRLNQTTASISVTIPSPTNTTAGRILRISNIGTAIFTVNTNSSISPGTSSDFVWNGTTWDLSASNPFDFWRESGTTSGVLPNGTNDTTKQIQRLGSTVIGGSSFSQLYTGVITPSAVNYNFILAQTSLGRGQILYDESPLSYYFEKTLPVAVNDYVDLMSITQNNGGGINLRFSVTVTENTFASTKSYLLTVNNNLTAGLWRKLIPLSESGPLAAGLQEYEILASMNANVLTLRARKVTGATAGVLRMRIESVGRGGATATELSTTGTDATVYSSFQTFSAARDFFRSGTGTTEPDGVNDTTEAIARTGTVGIGKVDPSTNASALDLTGAFLNRSVDLTDFAANGAIGTAAATVDIASYIRINQTTASITLTIPNPTNTTAGRTLFVSNIGTALFTINSTTTIAAGATAKFIWNGTVWSTVINNDYDFWREVGVTSAGMLPNGANDNRTKQLRRNGSIAIGGDNADYLSVFSGVASAVVTNANVILSDSTVRRGQLLFGNSPLSYFFTRSIPTAVGDYADLAQFITANSGHNFRLQVSISTASFAVSKSYIVTPAHNATGGAWRVLVPVSDSGPFNSVQNFEILININNNLVTLRARRTLGTLAGTLYVRLESLAISSVAATELTTTGTDATIYPYYQSTVGPITTDWSYKSSAGLSTSLFAWKGNRFTPDKDVLLYAMCYYGTIVANGVYQAAVITGTASPGNVATAIKSRAYTVGASPANLLGAYIWLEFETPVLLVAGTIYGLLVGRTDSTDTYILPVNLSGGSSANNAVPMIGLSHGNVWRVASAALTIGTAIDVPALDSMSCGYKFKYPDMQY